MQSIKTISLAPDGNVWLASSHQPRILHVFDDACNLINERGGVLSIVSPQIGNGPFNLVMEEDVLFCEHIHAGSKISMYDKQLVVENLTINLEDAGVWLPRPDWETLHTLKEDIRSRLAIFPATNYEPPLPTSLLNTFSTTLANAEISSALHAAQKLAGLGQGLTPSGDDYIIGAILATWIIHPAEIAGVLAEEITDAAAPLTTSLSAAWLRSAGKGEAGILWHNFFNALIVDDRAAVQLQITKLLAVGHTSGADAFAGFRSTMIHNAETEKK